jgi:hypothetical protein
MLDLDIITGIAAGICVFVVTIGAVIYLLLKDGIFGRLAQQKVPTRARLELHDFLLKAAEELPKKPKAGSIEGPQVVLKPLNPAEDAADLFTASNGQEWKGQSSYEANILWKFTAGVPSDANSFHKQCQELADQENGLHFCIVGAFTLDFGVATYLSHNFRNRLNAPLATRSESLGSSTIRLRTSRLE